MKQRNNKNIEKNKKEKRKEKIEYFISTILDKEVVASDIIRSTAYLMEAINQLRKSIEKGTYETNRLTSQIKKLTWLLVIIGVFTIILMGIQIFN